MDDLHAMFDHSLREAYHAEKLLVQELKTLADESQDDVVRETFNTHRRQTETQVKRIEKVFEALGRDPQIAESPGIEGLVQERHQLAQEVAKPELIDTMNIAANVKVERYEISAYEHLLNLADKLGYTHQVDPLRQNLNEEMYTLGRLQNIAAGRPATAEREVR